MHSVTLDSNTYISAFNFGGPPLEVFNLVRLGLVRLDVSSAILTEFGDVLRSKFSWSEEDITDAQQEGSSLANHVTPALTLRLVIEDPDDNRILECAAAALSDYLVTGGKHLLRLRSHDRTQIVKASDFLTLVRQQEAI